MINNKKEIKNMVKNDIDICHPYKHSDRVLFHKCIFENEELARKALKEKNLAPGEIAVARYYVNYNNDFIGGAPTFDAIRMVMAIGGATPLLTNDTYFFNDSYEIGENDAITKSQLDEILLNYYNKEEIDNIIDNLGQLIDTSIFATKDDLNNAVSTKLDTSIFNEHLLEYEKLKEEVNKKIDASYLENYFENNVENTVNQIIEEVNIPNIVQQEIENQNIPQLVSDAVDQKLEGFDGITTETLDEALEKSSYVNTNIIQPIEELNQKVQNIIDASVKNVDGGEEGEWIIE